MSFLRFSFIALFLVLQSIPPVLYYYNQYRFTGLAEFKSFPSTQKTGLDAEAWPLTPEKLFDLSATQAALQKGLISQLSSPSTVQPTLDNFSTRLVLSPNSTIVTAGLIASLLPLSSVSSQTPQQQQEQQSGVTFFIDQATSLLRSIDQLAQAAFDPFDERYCWRMFSTLSQATSCSIKFSTKTPSGPVDLDLQRIGFHSAWLELLSTCRLTIRDRVGRQLCRSSPNPSLPVFRKGVFHLRSPQDSLIASHWPSLDIDPDFSLVIEPGKTNICPLFPKPL